MSAHHEICSSEWCNLTLREKFVSHFYGSPRHKSVSRVAGLARFFFIFQSVTQLYVTVRYLVPYVFSDFNPWLQYTLKVFFCYLFTVSVANWLCVILYKNIYMPSKDRSKANNNVFDYTENLSEPVCQKLSLLQTTNDCRSYRDDQVIIDVTEKGGLPWHFCERCKLTVPPRCHHCIFCAHCILRRDHHCHLIGGCIGHWNQRYFVILSAYVIIAGYVGAFLTITYLRGHHKSGENISHYFFPIAVLELVTGNADVLRVLLIFQMHVLCLLGPIANIYFLSQLTIIMQGKTLYEVANKVNIKVTSQTKDNLRLVFGDYWLVNFLFPAVILFKQRNSGLRFDNIHISHDEHGVRKKMKKYDS